ncbi:hypothetical protein BC826DRAFT_215788 [Russula brevipes]|nr:hypothetical protein BC826DRAFT_215788 [Russula brevipes]
MQKRNRHQKFMQVKSHLSALQRGIHDLDKTHKVLLRKNRQLQQEIDRLHNETDVSIQPSHVKSGGKSNSLLHLKVNELQLEVRRLKKARTLERKKISQLRLKEAHRDAEELQDEQVHGVPNVEHKMKKLLRYFHSVVSSPSLGEDEECSICAETLELNKCSSLPCQHIFCDNCLSKMSGGERISCPQCRRQCDIESVEQVEFTATQQWDQLLEIAQQFAAMEEQLGPDTSEEEEEENLRENFIDNSDAEASTASREQDTASDAMQEDESIRDEKGNAEPGIGSYSQSGATEKRRRMKRLVAQREQKRVRRR